MNTPALDAVERLLDDHLTELAGSAEGGLLAVDCPALAQHWATRVTVSSFSDDARGHKAVEGVRRVEPPGPLSARVAVIRAPKSNQGLDEYLAWAHASGAELVLVGARIKDLNRSMNQVLARRYGQVQASLGKHKARLLIARDPLPQSRVSHLTGWPRQGQVQLGTDPALVLWAHGNTFGGTRLDAGTALLLDHLTPAVTPRRILDWGSGNGVISATLQQRYPQAEVVSVDQSWAAARATALTRQGLTGPVSPTGGELIPNPAVHWAEGVAWLADQREPFDLIVSNPPFHQGVAKESGPTRALLELAPDRLTAGGELWLVHNSHLPWLDLLRASHPDTHRVAQDRQFSVLACRP